MLAAMGPWMLELAGSRTDGSILWLSGPRTVAGRSARPLEAAADGGGPARPPHRGQRPGVRDRRRPRGPAALVGQVLADYNDLPSYRAVMDVEGAAGPEDVSLVGNEDEVREGLARFADAGTTDFSALEFTPDPEVAARTRSLLQR